MKLIIEDDEGRKTVVPVVRDEITIGRQDGNTIRLTERNVSRRHARFYRENGSLVLEDLNSYNGVRVNGERIGGPTKVKEGDLIEIGDYDLGIQGKLDPLPAGSPAAMKPPAPSPKASGEMPKVSKKAEPPAPAPAAKAEPPPQARAAAAEPPPKAEPEPAPAPATTGQSAQAAGATAIIRLSDLAKQAGPAEVRDLAKNEMPRLVGLNGQFRAKEFYLQKSEVKFGRTDDNDIGIDHQSISRQHGRFVLEEAGWKVYDNKSANGIHINGEEYAVSAVKAGDTVELGHVKFRFCAPGERFTPPPEASKEAPAAASSRESVAAVSSAARSAPAASAGGKSKMPLILGGVGAVVVIAVIAVVLMKGGGGGGGGAEAIKEGDSAFAAHDYIKAAEAYEQASKDGTRSANLKKAKEEVPAQQAYNDMQKAIASGDFDKAKAAADTCTSDADRYYAKQCQAKADAIKAGQVKQHLDKAKADPDSCAKEAGIALQIDPANEEAQKVSSSCKGAATAAKTPEPRQVARQDPPPRPAAPAGPSQDERNANAAKFVSEGNAAYAKGDMDGACDSYAQAFGQKPKGPTLAAALRGLGTCNSKKGNNAEAVKYFKMYYPLAPDAEKAKVKQIIDYYSKQ